MPYCPNCRSEFRPGFTSCKACGGVQLVEELEPEVLELSEADLPNTLPVGFTLGGSGNTVEVDGEMIDPSRVFILAAATRVRDMLADSGVPSLIVPLENLQLPDNVPRFEVRVLKEKQEHAEKILVELWRESLAEDGEAAEMPADIETCPACGAKVPLDVEECPECELVIGTGAERSADA